MSKKLLILGLVLALAAALAGPVAAKKKGPKPYKSEEVSIEVGHPFFFGTSGTLLGLTPQEFINSCAIPSSNGFDAYVFEVPKDYQKTTAAITATGVADGSPVEADMDIYLYDSTCTNVGAFNAAGTDESGVMSPGTAFVVVHNYTGGPTTAQISLKPY